MSESPDGDPPDHKSSGFAQSPRRTLPVGYEVIGTLLGPISIGAPILLLRFVSNGIVRPGLFTSSEVTEIRLVTQNSVYRVEIVPDAMVPPNIHSRQT